MYINANALRAAAHCAASKDIRHYLNGVYVKFKTEERATVAGTDGHCLFVCLADTQNVGDLLGTALIIPNDALKKLDKRAQTVELTKIGENAFRLGDIVFTPVDGTFPDIGRVIPDASTIASRELSPRSTTPICWGERAKPFRPTIPLSQTRFFSLRNMVTIAALCIRAKIARKWSLCQYALMVCRDPKMCNHSTVIICKQLKRAYGRAPNLKGCNHENNRKCSHFPRRI